MSCWHFLDDSSGLLIQRAFRVGSLRHGLSPDTPDVHCHPVLETKASQTITSNG